MCWGSAILAADTDLFSFSPLPYLQPVAGCQGMNFHFLPRESITWLSPEFALSELLHPPDLWLLDERLEGSQCSNNLHPDPAPI